MKFTCEKESLLSALSMTSRVVSQKNSILALEGILVRVEKELTLTGYNLETGIRTTVPAAIEEAGSLVLSARLFLEIVRKMPNQEITIYSQDFWVTILCGPVKFQIMAIDPEDYPDLPDVTQNQQISLEQDVLRGMINTTLFAVSTNESRPIHTGALFEVTGTKLCVVGVDGYRLALRREELNHVQGGEQFSFVVPRLALAELEKICSGEDGVTISVSEKHILFQMGDSILVTRRLEGEFLAYNSAIPTDNQVLVTAGRKELLSAIDRVSLMISEKTKAPLRCYFMDSSVEVSSKTAVGEAKDCCPLAGNGCDLEIGFNHRFLQEALRAAPAEEIRMEFSTPVTPCLIMPTESDDDSFCYMVLPVRLKAN